MTKFRTLDVAIKFYKKAKNHKLPNRHLQDQFDRALLSIILNLSEGNAKPTKKDRRKFFYISYGSFREVQTLLTITDEKILLQGSDSLGAHLYRLCKGV
jgi:four helix bundle protein